VTDQAKIEALRRTDAAFFAALVDRDITTLDALLARDFLIVEVAGGSVHPRASFLDAIGSGAVAFREITTFPDEAIVRLVGPGAGIVVARTPMSFEGPEGAHTTVDSRYIHVSSRGPELAAGLRAGTPIPGNPDDGSDEP
jgi:ketosteroid isomerase-like protein